MDFEQSVFLEEVIKKEKLLFGMFKGCGRGKKNRRQYWNMQLKWFFSMFSNF